MKTGMFYALLCELREMCKNIVKYDTMRTTTLIVIGNGVLYYDALEIQLKSNQIYLTSQIKQI